MVVASFGSFRAKLLTDRQTDKQRRLHILLGGGNKLWTGFTTGRRRGRCTLYCFATEAEGSDQLPAVVTRGRSPIQGVEPAVPLDRKSDSLLVAASRRRQVSTFQQIEAAAYCSSEGGETSLLRIVCQIDKLHLAGRFQQQLPPTYSAAGMNTG